MTLASEHAFSDAFLVSGDEDLREAVKAVQDRGVRVVVVGVEAVKGFNQSRELVADADEVVILSKQDLAPIVRLRAPVDVVTPLSPNVAPSALPAVAVPFADAGRGYAEQVAQKRYFRGPSGACQSVPPHPSDIGR